MKQPFHHSDDPAEVLVQKLEEQQAKEEIFHTDPIIERFERVSIQDPYSFPLPSSDSEFEQARQNIIKADQTENDLASEKFIDDITSAKHPGPISNEAYLDFRNQESSNKLESGEIWAEKTLEPGTRLVRVLGPDSNPYSVYWTSEDYFISEGIIPDNWNGSFEDVDINKVKSVLALPEQKFNDIEIYTVPETDDGTGIKVYESVVAPSYEKLESGECNQHMGGGIQYIVPEHLEKENVIERVNSLNNEDFSGITFDGEMPKEIPDDIINDEKLNEISEAMLDDAPPEEIIENEKKCDIEDFSKQHKELNTFSEETIEEI